MNCSEVIANILKAEGIEILTCFPHNDIIDSAAALGIHTDKWFCKASRGWYE